MNKHGLALVAFVAGNSKDENQTLQSFIFIELNKQ